MSDHPSPSQPIDTSRQFVEAVSGLFECLGRAIVCLDREFRIVHASDGLDGLVAPGASEAIEGRAAADVFGADLFGEQGRLRRALAAGERREGWGATIAVDGAPARVLSMSAAPVGGIESPLCDPRVAYLLVVRSGTDPANAETSPLTFFAGMVGQSPAMLRVFHLIQSLSESDATVLLSGESGTGKELVARALHLNSPRHAGPFVAVNCSALPGELFESELFGHVRGAFTGAVRDRQGRFAMAQSGTLFLDEVGELSLALQVKLLRVLQERSYERVGDSHSLTTDARIIAATNRDLQREVREGRFREDLYYRLRVVPIDLPPLRHRREDVEPLARHLLARVAGRQGRAVMLGPDAVRVLLQYPWPGNVRELENALEYAVAVSRGQTLHEQDLPAELRTPATAPVIVHSEPVAAADADDERTRLRHALETCRWNRAEAAKSLGMSRTTLWRRLRELGLES